LGAVDELSVVNGFSLPTDLPDSADL